MLSNRRRFRFGVLTSALLLGAAACKDKATAPPVATGISVVGSSTVTALVGDAQTIKVVVTDADAKPMVSAAVTFKVVDGGGTIAPANVLTTLAGEASTVWTLGSTTGLQRVQAQVAGVATVITFVATALPGTPASVAAAAGDKQTATAGSTLATQPAVVVKDRFGNPVSGISVFFTVTSGGGAVTTSGATTTAAGIATATGWRLGATAGANTLTALALTNGASGNPVIFSATGVPGTASTMTANSATSLTSTVGTSITPPLPSVKIVDAGGNPVSGAAVTFTASAGSTAAGAIKLTDGNGVATVDAWLLGPVAQNYTLTATSGALTPVVFTATARPSVPARLTLVAGDGQTTVNGRSVIIPPSVRLTDGFGNPLSGVEVVFEVTAGAGSAFGRKPVTDANGVAEVGGWTLGDNAGTNTLTATVTTNANVAGNPMTFTATATAGPPASVTIVAGNGQSVLVGSVLATAPSVVVKDNRGNPVSAVPVAFLVATGGGTITGSSPSTNAAGIATVGSWTLGSLVGAQTLIARVSGLSDITFTATGIASSPATATALSVVDLGTFPLNSLAAPLPSVVVRDAVGNPVSGATVTFTAETGSSSVLTGGIQITALDGTATLGTWNVGNIAGATLRVRAFVTGLNQNGNEPLFTARTQSVQVSAMTLAPGSAQTQTVATNTAVPILPAIKLTDANGNPVSGAQVQFVVQSGNGTLIGPALITTNVNGIATVGGWVTGGTSNIQIAMTVILTSNTAISYTFLVNIP